MTTFRPVLSTGEIYHVFNKSVADEPVFQTYELLTQILKIVDFYRFLQELRLSEFDKLILEIKQSYLLKIKTTLPLVELYCFSFMPNHYHFLLKQLQTNGISKFISDIQNSYAKYYNLKKNRNGSLFLNSFKAKIVKTTGQFIHLSRYIHINHITSKIIEFTELKTYPWTSFSWYLNPKLNRFIVTDLIINHFKTTDSYIKFLQNQVDYQKKLKLIKDLMLE